MSAGPKELLAEAAAEHPRVTRREAADAMEYTIGGKPFVALRGSFAEFHLRPDMVAAALRTPGASESTRGPDWVAFDAPAALERYDVDRLRSWFEMAVRLNGG